MQCFWLYGRVSLKCHNINYSTERSIDRSVAISLSKLPQRHFLNIENYRFKIRLSNLLHLNFGNKPTKK